MDLKKTSSEEFDEEFLRRHIFFKSVDIDSAKNPDLNLPPFCTMWKPPPTAAGT